MASSDPAWASTKPTNKDDIPTPPAPSTRTSTTASLNIGSVDASHRVRAWAALLIFSAVDLASFVTASVPTPNSDDWLLIVVASVSIVGSGVALLGYAVVPARFCGSILEGLLAMLNQLVWICGMPVIMDPNRGIALGRGVSMNNNTNNNQQQEITFIQNANIYFFSWACTIATVYILGRFARQKILERLPGRDKIGPKTNLWYLLTLASLVIMVDSLVAKFRANVNCGASPDSCLATNFAVALGTVGTCFSFAASVLATVGALGKCLEFVASIFLLGLYVAGVAIITFSDNGITLGNLYFATWMGAGVAMVLSARTGNDLRRKPEAQPAQELPEDVPSTPVLLDPGFPDVEMGGSTANKNSDNNHHNRNNNDEVTDNDPTWVLSPNEQDPSKPTESSVFVVPSLPIPSLKLPSGRKVTRPADEEVQDDEFVVEAIEVVAEQEVEIVVEGTEKATQQEEDEIVVEAETVTKDFSDDKEAMEGTPKSESAKVDKDSLEKIEDASNKTNPSNDNGGELGGDSEVQQHRPKNKADGDAANSTNPFNDDHFENDSDKQQSDAAESLKPNKQNYSKTGMDSSEKKTGAANATDAFSDEDEPNVSDTQEQKATKNSKHTKQSTNKNSDVDPSKTDGSHAKHATDDKDECHDQQQSKKKEAPRPKAGARKTSSKLLVATDKQEGKSTHANHEKPSSKKPKSSTEPKKTEAETTVTDNDEKQFTKQVACNPVPNKPRTSRRSEVAQKRQPTTVKDPVEPESSSEEKKEAFEAKD